MGSRTLSALLTILISWTMLAENPLSPSQRRQQKLKDASFAPKLPFDLPIRDPRIEMGFRGEGPQALEVDGKGIAKATEPTSQHCCFYG